MQRLGKVHFQANGKMDVFHISDVFDETINASDGVRMAIHEPQIGGDERFVTAVPPQIRSIEVDGDTRMLRCWFIAEGQFDFAYDLNVYIQYEEPEEVSQVDALESASVSATVMEETLRSAPKGEPGDETGDEGKSID